MAAGSGLISKVPVNLKITAATMCSYVWKTMPKKKKTQRYKNIWGLSGPIPVHGWGKR